MTTKEFLIKCTKDYFGTTDDPFSAAWLMPDGSFLQGWRQASRREFGPGFTAHSAVRTCMRVAGMNYGPSSAPWAFMEVTGAARLNPGPTSFNWEVMAKGAPGITDAQRRALRKACDWASECYWDVLYGDPTPVGEHKKGYCASGTGYRSFVEAYERCRL